MSSTRTQENATSHAGRALAVLLLCAFAVNVDVTLVNVTLPTLSGALDASNRDLQWVVDAYTLTFAAFVLAAGALSDRVGRRVVLLAGLIVYGLGNLAGAMVDSSTALIYARAVMGLGAALIFPATLSTLVHIFTERTKRARAIGLWGATTGVAVALGPIVGGAVLQASGWPATFWIKVPVAALAAVLVLAYVPNSRDPARPPIDKGGLILSTLAVATLVFTIIEAPENGWTSTTTLLGAGLAATLLAGFVFWERGRKAPLLDLKLLLTPRFGVAAAAITVAFFALGGFIFLITQYFQLLRDYTPLETGIRLLPVALSIGAASIIGTQVAVRFGTRIVVATGLASMSVMFAWTAWSDGSTSYLEIAIQMVLLGTGIGLTAAPATESVMGAAPDAKAGVASGVNDTTRELGATLGVAIIGSVFASLYGAAFDGLPDGAGLDAARDSLGGALGTAQQMGGVAGSMLQSTATAGFYDGLQAGCLVAAGVCAAGCLFTAAFLRGAPLADEGRMHAEGPPDPSGPASR